MKHILSSAVVMSIVGSSNAACAVEATLIAPSGIRAAVQQMIPDFEPATGHKVPRPRLRRRTRSAGCNRVAERFQSQSAGVQPRSRPRSRL